MVGPVHTVVITARFSHGLFGLVHLHSSDQAVAVRRFHIELSIFDILVVTGATFAVHKFKVVLVLDLIHFDALAGLLGLDNNSVVHHNLFLVFPEANEG